MLKGKTSFGTPRNTQKRVEFAEGNGNQHRWACHITGLPDREIRLQSGSNKFESQKVEILNLVILLYFLSSRLFYNVVLL